MGNGAPGERVGRDLGADGGQCGVEISWATLGENILLPGVHLEVSILPFQGQGTGGCH